MESHDYFTQLTRNLNAYTFENNTDLYMNSVRGLKLLKLTHGFTSSQKCTLNTIVNSTSEYETYYSSQLQWIIYATGSLVNTCNDRMFTHKMELTENEGKEMFGLLLEFGGDINCSNYYDETIKDWIYNYDTITSELKRKNNTEFLRYTQKMIN